MTSVLITEKRNKLKSPELKGNQSLSESFIYSKSISKEKVIVLKNKTGIGEMAQ